MSVLSSPASLVTNDKQHSFGAKTEEIGFNMWKTRKKLAKMGYSYPVVHGSQVEIIFPYFSRSSLEANVGEWEQSLVVWALTQPKLMIEEEGNI